mgnify:CR=1 FL=1
MRRPGVSDFTLSAHESSQSRDEERYGLGAAAQRLSASGPLVHRARAELQGAAATLAHLGVERRGRAFWFGFRFHGADGTASVGAFPPTAFPPCAPSLAGFWPLPLPRQPTLPPTRMDPDLMGKDVSVVVALAWQRRGAGSGRRRRCRRPRPTGALWARHPCARASTPHHPPSPRPRGTRFCLFKLPETCSPTIFAQAGEVGTTTDHVLLAPRASTGGAVPRCAYATAGLLEPSRPHAEAHSGRCTQLPSSV